MDGGRSSNLDELNRIFPKHWKERIAFFAVLSGIPMVFLFEAMYVLPHKGHLQSTGSIYFYVILACFLMQNIYLNLLKVLVVDAPERSGKLPHILMPNWKYCFICRLNAPPRAYHCHVCNACILKRDHHSTFTGQCVGYNSHRYYFFMVMYCWIASLAVLAFHFDFCWSTIKLAANENPVTPFIFLFMPQFAFIFRFLTFWQFFVALTLMTSMCAAGMSSYLFGYQLFLVSRGQTAVEFREGIRIYDRGVWNNFQDVIGTRMWLAWISPLIESPLTGDGLKFPERFGTAERTKDL